MNRLSQTLTYAGISGTLPSLKEQLNSKNFPKYTIPQTYYESYLSILAVKKNPLVQGTLKATKEGKIKLINFSDPLNDSDKKSILFDAITTLTVPVQGNNKFEIYVNAQKKTGYVRNVDKEAIGIRTNETALYSYLQSGYISYILATKDTEVTNNIKLHTLLAEVYADLFGKVIESICPITGEEEAYTRLCFLLSMYYFQVMCGYDFEKSLKIALTVKNVDPVAIGNRSRAFASEQIVMKDINDFIKSFEIEFPFVKKQQLTLRSLVNAVSGAYSSTAMFAIEHFGSFLNMIESVNAHSGLYKDQAIIKRMNAPLIKNVEKILLLISGEV
jgi:hypothetical protein